MFQKLLSKIAARLDKSGIPYMVIGGQAVLLYGEPRLTKDIDITLGVGVEDLKKVLRAVAGMKLKVLVDHVEDFVKKTMVLPAADSSGLKVDFIFSFSPYERQAISRAVRVRLGKSRVKFASREDVIIHKIIAGRARDLEDVRSIILKNPGYDKRYVRKWLKEFDESLGEDFFRSFQKINGKSKRRI
jgi:predicted nucleotidyltransferase